MMKNHADKKKLIYREGCVAQYIASDVDGIEPNAEVIDVAHSLLSRYSKGIQNWNQNIVLEVYKVDKNYGCESNRKHK